MYSTPIGQTLSPGGPCLHPRSSIWQGLSKTSNRNWKVWGRGCRNVQRLHQVRGTDQSWIKRRRQLYAQQLNYYQGLVGVLLRWICKLGWVDILIPPLQLVSSVREDKLQYILRHWLPVYTMKQFNQSTMGVWWHGVKLWPTAFCHAAALVKAIPQCKGSDTGGYAWTAREASNDDLFCRCQSCMMSADAATVTNWCDPLYQSCPNHLVVFQAAEYGGVIKLRMMDVLVEDPSYVLCDNEAVVENSTSQARVDLEEETPSNCVPKHPWGAGSGGCADCKGGRMVRLAWQISLQSSWWDQSFRIYHSASYGKNGMAIGPVKRLLAMACERRCGWDINNIWRRSSGQSLVLKGVFQGVQI